MWWTISLIVALAVIAYLAYKDRQGDSMKLKGERIIDEWFALISGAQGKGDALTKNISRLLDAVKVPNLVLEHKEIHLGLWSKMLKGTRKFLVVENKYLKGYRIFIGAHDYGEQLSVSWYLTLEQTFLSRLATFAAQSTIFGLFFFPLLFLVQTLGGGRRSVVPEMMDLFDLEELRAYSTTVFQAAKQATDDLMKEMDLDSSKISKQTRGFLNIS
ncbi:MAG: hypothetical protein UX89_C0027G0002 [Parcubacteria group bacterium GW2011_GWA2_47_16]|nr:MAG: hypothetical protein UX89_C0027G0002 [Parcubacteria group bacterium GW2011_GWA2_47_16]